LGQFQPSKAQLACTACKKGKYRNSAAASSTEVRACVSCKAGSYSSTAGELACTSCVAGKFQGMHEETNCKTCAAGHYQDSRAQIRCKACAAGMFAAARGQTACKAWRTFPPGFGLTKEGTATQIGALRRNSENAPELAVRKRPLTQCGM
jgi:hypothetical protein